MNTICQVAIVVRDINRAAKNYADIFGVDVPKIITTDPENIAHTKYCGAPSQARAKLAFFQMGQVALELIEPIGEPSTWRDHLEQHGEGVHHVAFRTDDMQKTLSVLNHQGLATVQTGDFT